MLTVSLLSSLAAHQNILPRRQAILMHSQKNALLAMLAISIRAKTLHCSSAASVVLRTLACLVSGEHAHGLIIHFSRHVGAVHSIHVMHGHVSPRARARGLTCARPSSEHLNPSTAACMNWQPRARVLYQTCRRTMILGHSALG